MVPSLVGSRGSAPAAASTRIIGRSVYLAARKYGVAPSERLRQREVFAQTADRRGFRELRVDVRAMGEQRLHQIEIAGQHRGVQRGEAGVGGIRIGALIEQKRRERAMAAVRRQQAARCSRRAPVVDVCSRRQQQPRRFEIALPRREQQRRAAALLDFADIDGTSAPYCRRRRRD